MLGKSIRLQTWNIGTLTRKTIEIVDTMVSIKVNILCLPITKWIGEKARMVDKPKFKLWYIRKNKTRNGAGVIIYVSLRDEVVCVM